MIINFNIKTRPFIRIIYRTRGWFIAADYHENFTLYPVNNIHMIDLFSSCNILVIRVNHKRTLDWPPHKINSLYPFHVLLRLIKPTETFNKAIFFGKKRRKKSQLEMRHRRNNFSMLLYGLSHFYCGLRPWYSGILYRQRFTSLYGIKYHFSSHLTSISLDSLLASVFGVWPLFTRS